MRGKLRGCERLDFLGHGAVGVLKNSLNINSDVGYVIKRTRRRRDKVVIPVFKVQAVADARYSVGHAVCLRLFILFTANENEQCQDYAQHGKSRDYEYHPERKIVGRFGYRRLNRQAQNLLGRGGFKRSSNGIF